MFGDDADEAAVFHHREGADAAVVHQLDGVHGEGGRGDRDDFGLHRFADGEQLVFLEAALRHQLDDRAVGDQADQAVVLLHRDVADAAPVHEDRRPAHRLVGMDGAEVGGHELLHPQVVVLPAAGVADHRQIPLRHRDAFPLLPPRRAGDRAQPLGGGGLVRERREPVQHPAGAAPAGLHPLLHDADIAVHIARGHFLPGEPVADPGQEFLGQQFARPPVLAVEPGQLRHQAEAARGQEVLEHFGEGERFGRIHAVAGKRTQQAEPDRGVRHLVRQGRPGGQVARLDAQVRFPVGRPVAGPVPPPHRPVVQGEGGKPRRVGLVFLFVAGVEEHRVVRDVLPQ